MMGLWSRLLDREHEQGGEEPTGELNRASSDLTGEDDEVQPELKERKCHVKFECEESLAQQEVQALQNPGKLAVASLWRTVRDEVCLAVRVGGVALVHR
eukprot:SAG11_NODE_7559_length_1129_cov_1.299029_2_plen_99_part_00